MNDDDGMNMHPAFTV